MCSVGEREVGWVGGIEVCSVGEREVGWVGGIEVCVLLGKGRWAGWEGLRCVFCWGKGGGLGGRD